jgi:hypothetical protein
VKSDAISLLRLEPDLAALLPPAHQRRAYNELVVRTFERPRGRWQYPTSRTTEAALGILILEGLLLREVRVDRTPSAELLGEGDLIRPWTSPHDATWNGLSRLRLAFLDEPFVRRLASYPKLFVALTRRLDERANRLAEAKAISQATGMERRILALFSHLAARWGKVTPEGTLIPVPLTHNAIGHLIGARRPTITTALSALATRDELIRRHDGSWLLPRLPRERRFQRSSESQRGLQTLLGEHGP